jgi:paraquat-inducible protein B
VSKKINTTSIGLFIVTGLALGVTGLLLFSSSKMFSQTRDIIVYFNDSLNGLNEGAAVKYRGVTIGSVKRVMVQFNQQTNDYAMPVILELEERLLRERMPSINYAFSESAIAERIKVGLRASLGTESLVTGVLFIGIDIDPNAPPPVFHQLEKIYPEIPTKPTQIQQLMQNLASLDVKSLQTNLNGLITKLDATVGRLDMAQISQDVTNLLASINRLVSSPDITNGLASIKPTLDQYRELGAKLTSKIDPLADSITNSLAEANLALAQLRGAGETLRRSLAPDSPLRNNLDQALEQLSGAAQSISSLVDFLKQHPNALITGREIIPKKP